ncbi:tetratricopeptide repeat protein, partial [Escherichia coli]
MDVWWLIIMEIYDSEDIKVYMLTKRILFSVMLIVSPSVVASEKAHELYDSIYGGKPAPD